MYGYNRLRHIWGRIGSLGEAPGVLRTDYSVEDWAEGSCHLLSPEPEQWLGGFEDSDVCGFCG